MRGEQVLHGLGADAPLQGAIDVGLKFFRREARALVERKMQAKQAPGGVLEAVELVEERAGQLLAPDQPFKRLMDIERRGDELARSHGAAIGQFDAGRAAILDNNAVNINLGLKSTAGGDERFHQSAREIE